MFVSKTFWKADWFLSTIIVLLFISAYVNQTLLLKKIELFMYDIGLQSSAKPASDHIVILDIDDESIELIGRWPWPRTVMADMLTTLKNADARMVGVDVFYSEKQVNDSMVSVYKLAKVLQEQADALLKEAAALEQAGNKEAAAAKYEEADKKVAESDELVTNAEMNNGDARLVKSVVGVGNVFMPMFYEEGELLGRPDAELPPYINRMNVKNVTGSGGDVSMITADKLSYPFAELAEASAGIGFLQANRSRIDGVLRSEPLMIEYYGKFFPSMSLVMVAKNLNLSTDDIHMSMSAGLQLGALSIATNSSMQILPMFHADAQGGLKQPFRHVSFYDVKSGKVSLEVFKDKIVLIGMTATGIGEIYNTPVFSGMSGVDYHANVIESLMNKSLVDVPEWAPMLELGLLVFIGLYLITLLPRLSAVAGMGVTLLLLLLLVGAGFVLLTESGMWLQTTSAAALLFVGHVVLTTKRFFASEESREKISSESAETNKMLALSFQSQGMLDMAFDKFKKCPKTDDILGSMYTLALDFERKRQFNKATAVYEYIYEANHSFKDVKKRMERTKDAGETMIYGQAGASSMGTLMITGGAKPTLGRYEIIKEIGKGAMGTVYLGKDPKINREVAIKTMALSQEFEGDELQDVKERFFREAETAGMLNHPNIVTMYDAGEEHDLAYIAMEYLQGTDLSPYTKKEKLLPQMATLKIIGKVAEALHYASQQRVVHRDIKPANIMLLKDKTVKVTDFGIARVTASSKTKTGLVLGTPSYMSPEQLSGKHVDGRSDIFSLGVMTYEMLVGQRPFKGDSMATLLFQIANEPHPDIRELDPKLPEHVSKLIDAMLEKKPEKRLPNGAAVIRGIIACLKVMAAQGR